MATKSKKTGGARTRSGAPIHPDWQTSGKPLPTVQAQPNFPTTLTRTPISSIPPGRPTVSVSRGSLCPEARAERKKQAGAFGLPLKVRASKYTNPIRCWDCSVGPNRDRT